MEKGAASFRSEKGCVKVNACDLDCPFLEMITVNFSEDFTGRLKENHDHPSTLLLEITSISFIAEIVGISLGIEESVSGGGHRGFGKGGHCAIGKLAGAITYMIFRVI